MREIEYGFHRSARLFWYICHVGILSIATDFPLPVVWVHSGNEMESRRCPINHWKAEAMNCFESKCNSCTIETIHY